MKVLLFDTMETPPRSKAGHIIVYAGVSAAHENRAITYIDCVYDVSGHLIEFRRNVDLYATRFEVALKWAVSYAESLGVSEIYAMFTLDRTLDMAEIHRICPEGLVDCRQRREASPLPLPGRTNAEPGWAPLRTPLGSNLNRACTVDNRMRAAGNA
jgi:hypothetical protein